MCGIVGAIAERNVTEILLEGLKRLEYRGYDSAGIALLEMQTRSSEPLVAGSVRLPGCATGRKGSLLGSGSLMPEAKGSKSLKAAKDFAVSGIGGAGGIEGAPPSAGSDRQLVLYTWFHTAMNPGSEPKVVLTADQLDKGLKSLFKKLLVRRVTLEIEFDALPPGGGPRSTMASRVSSRGGPASQRPPPVSAAQTGLIPKTEDARTELRADASKGAGVGCKPSPPPPHHPRSASCDEARGPNEGVSSDVALPPNASALQRARTAASLGRAERGQVFCAPHDGSRPPPVLPYADEDSMREM